MKHILRFVLCIFLVIGLSLFLDGCSTIQEQPPEPKPKPKLVRQIAFIPCVGNPLYLFISSNGAVASFDMKLVSENEKALNVFLKFLNQAKLEVEMNEKIFRQKNCIEKKGKTI